MSLHPHSWVSYQACVESDAYSRLVWTIARFYHKQAERSFTDRQVKEILYAQGVLPMDDMNMVRPKITSLIDDGYLRECGEIEDALTHRTVRLVRWDPHDPTQGQMELPLG